MEYENRFRCHETDGIEYLGLSRRVHNALLRGNVRSIRNLLDRFKDDTLLEIRSLGRKGLEEITSKVRLIEILSPLEQAAPKTEVTPVHEVIKWQRAALREQISLRRLHPDVIADGVRVKRLISGEFVEIEELHARLTAILTLPDSVAAEFQHILTSLEDDQREVLRRRHKANAVQLDTIARELSISTVLAKKLEQIANRRLKYSLNTMPMVRTYSALLFAQELGLDLTYEEWCESLKESGILGNWTTEKAKDFEPAELILYICRPRPTHDTFIATPKCVDLFRRLVKRGKPNVPARVLNLFDFMSAKESRLIDSHLNNSGAVSLPWLKAQAELSRLTDDLRWILELKDFVEIDNGWYGDHKTFTDSRGASTVFHKTVQKMILYCGPLIIGAVQRGLERWLIRSNFPVAPKNVLEWILAQSGYTEIDSGWGWQGILSAKLSNSERLIWYEIVKHRGRVHESTLRQAIKGTSVSLQSMKRTLARSPLFEPLSQDDIVLNGHLMRLVKESIHKFSGCIAVSVIVPTSGQARLYVGRSLERHLQGHWHFLHDRTNSTVCTVIGQKVLGLRWILYDLGIELGGLVRVEFQLQSRVITVSHAKGSV